MLVITIPTIACTLAGIRAIVYAPIIAAPNNLIISLTSTPTSIPFFIPMPVPQFIFTAIFAAIPNVPLFMHR
jgi:hypothetical protein